MSAILIEALMDSLIETGARIKKLALVDVNHSDSSFDKVVDYVQDSVLLADLDLSW